MTPEQRRLFDERVRQQNETLPGYADLWRLLCERLLAYGGVGVVPPLLFDTLIPILVDELSVVDGENVILVGGEPSNCHQNVQDLIETGLDVDGETVTENWTGYALSDDGLWRQHSWASAPSGRTFETTVRRSRYAGVCVNCRPCLPRGQG